MLDLFEFHATPTTGVALLGLGCGVGVGAGAPVRLSGVPILGDAISGIGVGLSQLDASLGRPSERLRSLLARVSPSPSSPSGSVGASRRASSSSSAPLRLSVGAGCGLGFGYGVGVGLFVKKSAGEALKAKVAAALERVRGFKAGLSLQSPATSAAAAAAAAPSPRSRGSSLESRVEELESLLCELRPEHGLCVARRKKKKEEEEEVKGDEGKN